MADAVTSQTIIDGERNCVMKFTNVSDGTGESAVAKVDVSALASNAAGIACSEVRLIRSITACTNLSSSVRAASALSIGIWVGEPHIQIQKAIFILLIFNL